MHKDAIVWLIPVVLLCVVNNEHLLDVSTKVPEVLTEGDVTYIWT